MQQPVAGYGVLDDDHINAEADAQARRLREEIEREFVYEAPSAEPVSMRSANVAREVTQAVSVATAYFEDTLQRAPGTVLSAGSLPAEALGGMIAEAGFSEQEVRVRAMFDASMLADGAATTRTPMGWLAGVRGALRS